MEWGRGSPVQGRHNLIFARGVPVAAGPRHPIFAQGARGRGWERGGPAGDRGDGGRAGRGWATRSPVSSRDPPQPHRFDSIR